MHASIKRYHVTYATWYKMYIAFRFQLNYNMCITSKKGCGVALLNNLRHSSSLKIISVIFCNISCLASLCQFDKRHTTPYEMCHSPNCHHTSCSSRSHVLEWMYSSGNKLIAFPQSMSWTFRSSQHSMSSVTV